MNSNNPISDFPAKIEQTIAELQMVVKETSTNTYFNNHRLLLEVPEIIKQNLEQLNQIDDPYSSEFISIWNAINIDAQKFVSDLGMKIIEQAGAADLIVEENADQKKAE